MQQFHNKNSFFKQPVCSERRAVTTIPDHHKNPHKWTKYSLAHISNEEMSDKCNTQAAFSFMNALKLRRQINSCTSTHQEDKSMDARQIIEPPVIKLKSKAISTIQFRKPNSDATGKGISSVTPENGIKPIFKNSIIVMPEYVIGQKLKKQCYKKKNTPKQVDRLRHVILDHLQEHDEES